jgi:hypothetical protein
MAELRSDGSLEISVSCNLRDVRAWLVEQALAQGRSAAPNATPTAEELGALAAHWWEARSGDEVVQPAFVETSLSPDGGAVLVITYASVSGENLQLRSAVFAAFPPGHRTYFSVIRSGGVVVTEALLEAAHDRVTIPLRGKASRP